MLKLDSVSLCYPDGTQALADINLRINQGEFCVLLGSSGAGKSSLMGLVNGLVSATQGQLVFEGETITRRNLKPLQQKVSMIHQQLHLVPRVSVLNNVISGKLHQIPSWRTLSGCYSANDQRRACMLLDEVNLEEKHLYRRTSDLSGGQQQRVAIARAFMSSPQIVLADEPVSSLDPTTSRNVLASLKNTSRHHQATVICSLHQVEYALEFADRIVALKQGRLVYDGCPSQVDNNILDSLYALTRNHRVQPQPAPELAVA